MVRDSLFFIPGLIYHLAPFIHLSFTIFTGIASIPKLFPGFGNSEEGLCLPAIWAINGVEVK